MTIRVMIAEDERLAREELQYLLAQENDVELLPSAANGKELLQLVEEHEPDVIFLDVKMPEMEGVKAARMLLARKKQPFIVFSTAHEDYAVEAFGLNAVDYLLKPVDPQRLKEAMVRIRKRLKSAAQPTAKLSKLLIEDADRLIVIDPNSVIYAMRDERVVQIHSATQMYTSKMTLQQLEEKLQSYPFFRTHRSYLVNLNFVSEVVPWFNGAYNLTLRDSKRTQIPVSRSYAKELLRFLTE